MLFTGFFGLQNRIFGKFVGFFIWKCLEAPINDDEFLDNSMIRDYCKCLLPNKYFLVPEILEMKHILGISMSKSMQKLPIFKVHPHLKCPIKKVC